MSVDSPERLGMTEDELRAENLRLSARIVQLSIECDRIEEERDAYKRAVHRMQREKDNAK